MGPETKIWSLFCSAVFFWMGVSLFLGARRHAESALAWMAAEGAVEPAQSRRLAFFYRLGGAFFAGFGVWLLWRTLSDPGALAACLPRQRLSRAGRLAGVAFFFLGGSLLAAIRAAAGLRLGAVQESWEEKADRAWGWVIVLVFLAFGAFLLRGAA